MRRDHSRESQGVVGILEDIVPEQVTIEGKVCVDDYIVLDGVSQRERPCRKPHVFRRQAFVIDHYLPTTKQLVWVDFLVKPTNSLQVNPQMDGRYLARKLNQLGKQEVPTFLGSLLLVFQVAGAFLGKEADSLVLQGLLHHLLIDGWFQDPRLLPGFARIESGFIVGLEGSPSTAMTPALGLPPIVCPSSTYVGGGWSFWSRRIRSWTSRRQRGQASDTYISAN